MMFFTTHNCTENFEEEEEEEGGIDDALLGELDDEIADDEELLGEDLPPVLKADPFETEEEDPIKDAEAKLYGEDEEEEDMDYDSFDDHDEM